MRFSTASSNLSPFQIDSGGPLIYKGHLLGLVSGTQSKHCYFKHSLAMYTKVSLYADWIESTTQVDTKYTNNFERGGLDFEREGEQDRVESSAVCFVLSPLLVKLILLKVAKSVLMNKGSI